MPERARRSRAADSAGMSHDALRGAGEGEALASTEQRPPAPPSQRPRRRAGRLYDGASGARPCGGPTGRPGAPRCQAASQDCVCFLSTTFRGLSTYKTAKTVDKEMYGSASPARGRALPSRRRAISSSQPSKRGRQLQGEGEAGLRGAEPHQPHNSRGGGAQRRPLRSGDSQGTSCAGDGNCASRHGLQAWPGDGGGRALACG